MLGIAHDGKYDVDVLRQNAKLNREESRNNYQKQANQKLVQNNFKIGDDVLLLRTHGANPKINPIWVGPYLVVRSIGPVNWGIMDKATKKTKVVHHNLLKPALTKCDATVYPSHKQGTCSDGDLFSRVFIRRDQPPTTDSPLVNTLDQPRFAANVLQDADVGNVPAIFPEASAQASNVSTRSGRISKPVIGSRLVDNTNNIPLRCETSL
jgi:hypothetical protein